MLNVHDLFIASFIGGFQVPHDQHRLATTAGSGHEQATGHRAARPANVVRRYLRVQPLNNGFSLIFLLLGLHELQSLIHALHPLPPGYALDGQPPFSVDGREQVLRRCCAAEPRQGRSAELGRPTTEDRIPRDAANRRHEVLRAIAASLDGSNNRVGIVDADTRPRLEERLCLELRFARRQLDHDLRPVFKRLV